MEEEKIKTENQTSKKSKKGLVAVIICLIILLAVAAGAAYYFLVYTKPETTFKKIIGEAVDSYESSIEESEFKTLETKIGANVQIKLEQADKNVQKIIDLINDLDVSVDVQMDKEEKQVVAKLGSTYKNKDLLNVDAYINSEEENSYVYFKDFFDKYIEVDMNDDSTYESLNEAFSNMYTNNQKINTKKAMSIIKKQLKNVVKSEYCNSSKETITVNGKSVKATKNTITMTGEQLKEEYITVINNLKDDKQFTECYENPNEIIEALEEMEDALEDGSISFNKNSKIEISVYTTGLTQEVVKTDITVKENSEEIVVEVTKVDEENYEFKMSSKQENMNITGNINIKEESDDNCKIKIEMNIPNVGEITVNLESETKKNGKIDKVDEDKTISQDELTEEDYEQILEKFQKSQLYEVINEFSNGALTKNLTSLIDEDSDDDDDEYDTYLNDDDDDDDEEEEDLTTSNNEIITYRKDQKIKFNVASGYKSAYSSDTYKSFDKNEFTVKVTSESVDVDKYLEEVEDTAKYLEESDYKDIKLSDTKTLEVDGRKYSYRTLDYKYSSYNYSNMYVCTKTSDKNIFVVEVKGSEKIDESDLKQFLKIDVTDM